MELRNGWKYSDAICYSDSKVNNVVKSTEETDHSVKTNIRWTVEPLPLTSQT